MSMRLFRRASCTGLFLALAMSAGCQRAPDVAATAREAATGPVPINAFFEEVFERELSRHPVMQSRLGYRTERLGEWDDVSDEAHAARVARTRDDLARLERDYDYASLDPAEQLSHDLFMFNGKRLIADSDFRRHAYVVDQFNGQLTDLITVLQNNHPIDTREDAEDYISRIAGLEGVLLDYVKQLKDRASFGVVPPAFSFPAIITDATRIASGAPIDDASSENTVYADFRDKLATLPLGSADREALLQDASAALNGPFRRGFDALINEVKRQQGLADSNHGVWALPDGDAYYRNRILHHTALSLSPDDIHQIGLDEVDRLHYEMRGTIGEVGFDGDLREFFEFIRDDPNNYHEDSDAGREQFLENARAQITEIYSVVDDYFNALPEADLVVRRVEPWRENSTSIAFYNRPSADGSKPGIYYAILADMSSVQKYVFTAITYHESVPGHHFQIALAQELDGLPRFRRQSGYGAFTEGWALYAEQLAREMGFYQNPYDNFGRLQNELWRAVRLVLDTGIHAKKWSREEAITYFRENTPLSEGDIVTEVERFFVNPGQALGYKLGMIKILELRELARQELGERFDIRDFHDAVIGAGSLPLPLLERRVKDWQRQAVDSH
ncbi:DUF885 domain-containing protein [Chromatocurvus halotolerans]|uniref:Uncharacterized protein (DUF885 family) n=1 Tax=Chromatocurvus halotolerans TaxID=1132028 RepID=A0A4R2KWN6_9GAMM|nr:DUF885 domain-containing protein [Chromatocurvus halotolerans]TCO78303.1 uncharacterized protein (DUF885 family) [Chromatocurvus halotolerans]